MDEETRAKKRKENSVITPDSPYHASKRHRHKWTQALLLSAALAKTLRVLTISTKTHHTKSLDERNSLHSEDWQTKAAWDEPCPNIGDVGEAISSVASILLRDHFKGSSAGTEGERGGHPVFSSGRTRGGEKQCSVNVSS